MLSESCKRFLVEKVLKECWHKKGKILPDGAMRCPKCEGYFNQHFGGYRTFTTIQDLYDLYSALMIAGKWNEFYCDLFNKWYTIDPIPDDVDANALFDAWLFCLDGEGYEERCVMVAEFLEG